MKLQIEDVLVKQLAFGSSGRIENGTVYIDREAVSRFIRELDTHITEVRLDIAQPGDSIRIMPVKDVIEPRVKVGGNSVIFPGLHSDQNEMAGEGVTRVLKGMAVVTTGKVVAFQEGVIDMKGPGADYTPFSKTRNLVITCEMDDNCTAHIKEGILRRVGLETALLIGRQALEAIPDQTTEYEYNSLAEQIKEHPELPRVGYIYMLQSQGLMHDTYLYGVDVKKILPTLLSPTEVMDGALISGNCVAASDKVTTYMHQNNPVIKELLKYHGIRYNFIGAIVTNENVTLQDKERSSAFTCKLARQLGVDAVIITEEGYGNPDTDLVMNCRRLEEAGIETVLITDEFAGRDGESQALADATDKANALISCGNGNPTVVVPHMDTVLGHLDSADTIVGGFTGSLREDGSIHMEIQGIIGATSAIGFHNLAAREG